MQTEPVFPQIIASGGLEAICGASIACGGTNPLWSVGMHAWLSILAGSLDAPESLPSGSLVAPGNPRFTTRG